MTDVVRLFCGFDPREAVAFHVFCQSVIESASCPVAFYPVHRGMLKDFDGQKDGTNAFTVSRYLIPYLCDYSGWALFMDGDMFCRGDIANLWAMKDACVFDKAVAVVKHDYKTKHARKYVGTAMENDNIDYPKKNWSSVILWNCAHYANRILSPEYVAEAPPSDLHRFEWLHATQIAALPREWNHLVSEDKPNTSCLYHFTLGIPGIKHYTADYGAWRWHGALMRALNCAGEDQLKMVERSHQASGLGKI